VPYVDEHFCRNNLEQSGAKEHSTEFITELITRIDFLVASESPELFPILSNNETGKTNVLLTVTSQFMLEEALKES